MPEFKNKEEYQKWKAERITSIAEENKEKREKEEKKEALRKEEEKLKSIWICPECNALNDVAALQCNCGYSTNKDSLQCFLGNMTSKELSKTISGELYLGNKECALFLANYLVKRFPDSDEAQDLAESANFNPGMINCPTCRNGISMKAPSCPHCGELLTDELRKKSTFITDLSNYVRKIDEKTKIVEKKGGAFGFLLGIPIAIVTLSLGIFLSGIPGLNLIGMPLTFVSILIPFVLPFMKYSFISGLCPYCSHQVLIQDNRTAASCPTCKNRIIITSNRFCRIS